MFHAGKSGNLVREFFRQPRLIPADRVVRLCRHSAGLLARLIFLALPGARKEQRPIHVRVLDIFFQVFSVIAAICGLIFVLYTAVERHHL